MWPIGLFHRPRFLLLIQHTHLPRIAFRKNSHRFYSRGHSQYEFPHRARLFFIFHFPFFFFGFLGVLYRSVEKSMRHTHDLLLGLCFVPIWCYANSRHFGSSFPCHVQKTSAEVLSVRAAVTSNLSPAS